jgi:hypothetical protein
MGLSSLRHDVLSGVSIKSPPHRSGKTILKSCPKCQGKFLVQGILIAVHVNVETQFIIKDLLPYHEAFITVLRGYI